MAKRHSRAVYWRRRGVLLAVVLLPVIVVGKALVGHASATTAPTPSATLTTSASAKAVASAAPLATETATASPTPTPTPTTSDCRNGDIAVSVSTDSQQYAIGSPVTIAMRIHNDGTVACTRDVGALPNEVYVTDADGLVVWTSDACQTDAKPQVVLMNPGSTFGNTQVWNGSNSGRDCTSAAPDATAGTYYAYARNDTVQSKPATFTIG